MSGHSRVSTNHLRTQLQIPTHHAAGFPKREPPKNKSKMGDLFFVVEKCPSSDQLYHTFHHNFTIKTPRVTVHFSQKPLQKPQKHTHTKKLRFTPHLRRPPPRPHQQKPPILQKLRRLPLNRMPNELQPPPKTKQPHPPPQQPVPHHPRHQHRQRHDDDRYPKGVCQPIQRALMALRILTNRAVPTPSSKHVAHPTPALTSPATSKKPRGCVSLKRSPGAAFRMLSPSN